ncbi:hypothetical protein DL98DRAFT_594999 [Cadophora sp. DSE1049]|nr:hypothetical protein DL98DRAFT_594999 [Cadophora sp. DSE1049]
MTEGQLEMWRSNLIEDMIDYLEDDEDYVVISINKKTGDIIQQYEYEYSLDRFLEHLASLQDIPVLTNLLPQDSWGEGGLSLSGPELRMMLSTGRPPVNVGGHDIEDKSEEKQANGESSRSGSPHTDPEFQDLDAISNPWSDVDSWMTYSDIGRDLSSEMIRERDMLYRHLEKRLGGDLSSCQKGKDKRHEKHELLVPTLPIIVEKRNEELSGVGNGEQVRDQEKQHGGHFRVSA